MAAAASVTCIVATGVTGVVLYEVHRPPGPINSPLLAAVDVPRSHGNEVSRDKVRSPVSPSPARSTPISPAPAPPSRGPRAPVAGLDQAQMNNAAIIARVGAQRSLSQRALVIAVATALQESDLYNSASDAVPESLNYPHQTVTVDFDSVGLFQQRPSQGWGSVAQLMDPAHAADLFFGRLVQVSGWQTMSVAAAAQAVQRSAFPGAYQKHQDRAQLIVNALA
jgi:hypothetical protein